MERQTVRELIPAIDALVSIRFESLIIACKVIDAKNSYGNVRIKIQPLNGSGEQWIELSRIVTQQPGRCTECQQPLAFVRDGVYQCLNLDHCRISGKAMKA